MMDEFSSVLETYHIPTYFYRKLHCWIAVWMELLQSQIKETYDLMSICHKIMYYCLIHFKEHIIYFIV